MNDRDQDVATIRYRAPICAAIAMLAFACVSNAMEAEEPRLQSMSFGLLETETNESGGSSILPLVHSESPRHAFEAALAGHHSSRFSPKPFELTSPRVSLAIHATFQLDVIHDFNALGLDLNQGVLREFITAEIPVGGAAADRDHRTALSVNQTFIDALASCETEAGRLSGYARANLARSITETEFQVYLAYAQLGWWKAGLDYSLVLNQSAYPDTLDFETSNVVPWVRYPQLSVSIPLPIDSERSVYSLVFGIEDAESDLTLPSTIADVSNVTRLPTLASKLVYKTNFAHLELAGIYRRLRAQGSDYESTVNGWGLWASGRIQTWGRDNIIYGFMGGTGIGAYADDTQGIGLDAAPSSLTDPSLRSIPTQGLWAAYQHWWNDSTRSTFNYGFLNVDNEFDPTPNETGTFHESTFVSANVICSPIRSVDVGVEYLYGIREVTTKTAVDGSRYGDNHRIQFTVRWNTSYRR